MTITAAADGSALGNPGPAGWAWYIDDEAWAAGGWRHGTNNMGELKAVLELFRATEGVDDDLLVLCDSQYVINAATKWMAGWKRKGWRKADGKPVMNVDLLQELDEALAGRRYRFEWVRGHVGHPLNEAADERARAVATAYQRGAAVPTGPGFPGRRGGTAPAVRTGSPSAPPTPGPAPAAPAPSAALFDLGEPDAAHVVPVGLTADEWQRLERIAREAGLPADEVLRGLVRDALRTSRRARSAG